ncbi:MAG: hypothetical protein AAGD10_07125 [Myxococcota bacterium]
MDVQPWVGLLALGALWLNGVLIAADALKRRSWLGRERGFRVLQGPTDGVTAWVEVQPKRSGWARWQVEQRGRIDSAGRLVWHDRQHRSEISKGEAEHDGRTVEVDETARAEVWPDPSVLQAKIQEGLDAKAWTQAGKGRGHLRTLSVEVEDAPVWIGGSWSQTEDGWRVEAPPGRPLVVAFLDPRRWLGQARRLQLAFALGTLLALIAITALCLWPPIFGPVSTAGGALGLIFFLLIQPAGTWVRGQTMEPSRRTLGGRLSASLNPGSNPR